MSDLDQGEFVIGEGSTTVEEDDVGTHGIDTWDNSVSRWTPSVTVNPASAAGDVTLSVAVDSGPATLSSGSPSGPPDSFNTNTGVASWSSSDTSSDQGLDEEQSTLSWTFSAPDSADCVVQLTVIGQ